VQIRGKTGAAGNYRQINGRTCVPEHFLLRSISGSDKRLKHITDGELAEW
jgi:hypothetical protein